ncbi:uncharacterized protein LOC143606177 [Bidens hawaiensis]|uniref:uncharacterized protein LOC143606177 n=1 Tax=Bidens hawaiensis TaxID=980011 RepID=UPI00404A5A42
MTHFKVINKRTDSSVSQLLEFLKFALPKENHIPASYYEAKKKLRKILLGYQSIDACVNDCVLFWKDNESKENCSVCNTSRWIEPNTKGKKVSHKVMRYFPLTSRHRRRYGSRFTAKDMIWHNTGSSTDGMMCHPVDGKAWQEFERRQHAFANEPRNVRLGLAADGFCPFGNMSLTYSMCPVVWTTYNTPPWLCMKESSFMLALLIPGPKSPGKDIDVFLSPLVDELNMLWEEGVRMRDASTDTIFNMCAALLWTINDFPACSSLSRWSDQGKRKSSRRLNKEQILEQLNSLPVRVPGKHADYGGAKRKRDESEFNWTKRGIFFELDYWSTIELKHNLDVMHVEKNVCESILGTLLMNDKSKDKNSAREDLEDMGIRKNLWLTTKKNKKVIKPLAPYSFKAKDREHFCKFTKGVRLPDGFGSNFRIKVVGSNIVGLKSHDYHILMQRLLPIGVRAGLDEDVSKTIIDFCIFFKKICAQSVDVNDMTKHMMNS